ncbi:MAG TPA: phytoene/squalene synthase family protein, partial [Acidimicrobiales bacterium]|nr:phytoene/squalene synthase family protein [Acidimicrobiales bacterium]
MNAAEAYRECEAITRREAKNFAYGIRLLRPPERQALSAVYALARRIDDIGDGEAPADAKLEGLAQVRKELAAITPGAGGDPSEPGPWTGGPETDDPVLFAIADAARRYRLPMGAFDELIEGCEMDVTGTAYATADDLVGYCRRVAGSIGRLSLAVFGTTDLRAAEPLADDLGVALQLTNILRDVLEDGARGRVYLPTRDAEGVGCPPDLQGDPAAVARLVAFECQRAREWFDRGLQLLPLLDRRSRACVG